MAEYSLFEMLFLGFLQVWVVVIIHPYSSTLLQMRLCQLHNVALVSFMPALMSDYSVFIYFPV
jgi:hypothetical protein